MKKRLNSTESRSFEIGYMISRSFLVPNSTFFSHYDGFFPSNSREMQIVARFVF